MHFREERLCPTVISKMGILRVRSRTVPRTSPMTLAISPGTSSSMRARMQAIFVAKGKVVEQVFHGGDVLFGKGLGDARTDTLDEFDRCIEREHSNDASSSAA